MENQRQVICPENEDLALFMWRRRQEMAEPKGLSERSDMTIYKAYCSVCNSKAPIKTLKEFSQIKGVGKWILRLMKGFFETDLGDSEPEDLTQEGKETKGTKRYVPQKNSVAYALLITLYRGMANGSEFMRKQELIDAAESSGLSRVPIAPESGKGKSGQFGNSPRDWYSGWNAMKTLVTKGLVVKSSCPAKYMLSQQGQEAARDCLSRSGFTDELPSQAVRTASDLGVAHANSANKEKGRSKKKTCAFAGVSEVSQIKRSIPQPPVLCRLKKDQVHALHESKRSLGEDCVATSTTYTYRDSGQVDFVIKENSRMNFAYGDGQHGPESSCSADSAQSSFTLKTCSSSDYHMRKSNSDALEVKMNALTVPPLSFGERFEEVYDVILILDDREQFTNHRSRSSKIIENIRSHFKIQVEVRRLPVGDGIWIARHKYLDDEYVLDFIVERKGVHDLRLSIRDNRYKDQKLRLLRCGLKKLIYLVEGDPNSCEAAESIKTACFTTEILEGFDVQRTSGLGDTLRKYGFLTQAITHYYRTQFSVDKVKSTGICPSYDEFVKKCQDLEKMTVSDVFATQLMQVAQVTETVAVAVLDLYPTLLSLAHAYSLLDGDVRAQEEMLKKQSNNLICEAASRNIFQLVWGG